MIVDSKNWIGDSDFQHLIAYKMKEENKDK
jgi:hypothetical protein